MKKFELLRETLLPVPITEAWEFFSNPNNLAKITPPDMSFRVISSNLPSQIYDGMLIKYIVKPLLGVPLNWVTKISAVSAPYKFVDEQLKGPYAFWYHEHTFEELGDKVLMKDKVIYAVPFGIFGVLANSLIVRNKLGQIFDYRTEKIREIFKITKK